MPCQRIAIVPRSLSYFQTCSKSCRLSLGHGAMPSTATLASFDSLTLVDEGYH
jgi:hypothetical protein